jgi:hypothetical protein
MPKMGLAMGLEKGQYCKRQNRWMFTVDGILGDFTPSKEISILPPEKAARPQLSFKEMNVQHLIEEVYYPSKPDWKPINITLFDLQRNVHPIFKWLNEIYDPSKGKFVAPNAIKSVDNLDRGFIRKCTLELYDGCGSTLESWIYEDCWPQSVNFQTLDFAQDGIVMCDLTLRYARAYIDITNGQGSP